MVKGPTSYGKNAYLSEISVDGQQLLDFEPGKMVYQTAGNLENVTATPFDSDAYVTTSQGDGYVLITVVSNDKQHASTYLVKN